MYGTPKGTSLDHSYASVGNPEEGSQVTARNPDALTAQGPNASSKGLEELNSGDMMKMIGSIK